MGERKDPYRNFRFKMEVGSITQAGFTEVSGYDSTVEIVEYREGNEVTTPRKLPGLTKYGNITLKWGVTDSTELYKWLEDCSNGTITRQDVTITAIDETGQDKAAWQIIQAWPTKYTAPNFNGSGKEVAIETIELAHEGMKRSK
ncbi:MULTISPECIES: phage tail protein [Paenibacillus]|jgi:phage tail-like protein|uniref:phage tail protein n=1 Tax=Paenibacillus nuruki TaxID=1886670 RepID=UPI00280609AE|nr:phage tail protein [Paenibacillus nuruki]CAJ1317740.1 phage tail protein [Paenibacillus nuruki]